MNCRHCNNQLTKVFADLQTCPPSNAMVKTNELNFPETYFPLKVFVCDSFAGLPRPSGKFQQDHGDTHYAEPKLAISLEQVQNNFNIFKCLDEKVIFIKGFFGETLPNNELVDKLAILRMDGDMYESTYDVFYSCYDKLADSGVCIIDDFCLKGARDCTHDFRESRNIHDTLVTIDKCGVYWIKNKI